MAFDFLAIPAISAKYEQVTAGLLFLQQDNHFKKL
jgi:hypothetical protein